MSVEIEDKQVKKHELTDKEVTADMFQADIVMYKVELENPQDLISQAEKHKLEKEMTEKMRVKDEALAELKNS